MGHQSKEIRLVRKKKSSLTYYIYIHFLREVHKMYYAHSTISERNVGYCLLYLFWPNRCKPTWATKMMSVSRIIDRCWVLE